MNAVITELERVVKCDELQSEVKSLKRRINTLQIQLKQSVPKTQLEDSRYRCGMVQKELVQHRLQCMELQKSARRAADLIDSLLGEIGKLTEQPDNPVLAKGRAYADTLRTIAAKKL